MSSSSSSQHYLPSPPTDGITSLAFRSDATPAGPHTLLATSWDGALRTYIGVGGGGAGGVLGSVLDCGAPVLCGTWGEGATSYSGGLGKVVLSVDHAAPGGGGATVGVHTGAVRCVSYSHTHRLVVSGSWDRTVCLWDPRAGAGAAPRPAGAVPTGERVYAQTLLGEHNVVVATAARSVLLLDMRRLGDGGPGGDGALVSTTPSSLKHQTRVLAALPDGSGWVTGSTEGRVGVDFLFPDPAAGRTPYAFKCHRVKGAGGEEAVYPVHALAFHPSGSFVSGGGDGVVASWDWRARKRLAAYAPQPTSVSALSYTPGGAWLAVASSYAYEHGPTPPGGKAADRILIRSMPDLDVRPKGV